MRLRKWQNVLLAAAVGGTVALSAVAHHGWSDYNEKQALTVTGVIRASGYENPHGFVRLEVQSSAKTWYVVLAPPSRMARRGLTREALQAGTPATVVGYQHRTKPDEMRAERITIAGKTTELR